MSDDEWDLDAEELEDGAAASQQFMKPPQLLIGIDTHPSMFVKTEEGLHAFHMCLLGLHTLLDQLLLKSDKNTVAVILAHESESKAMLIDFNIPVNEKLLTIKKLLYLQDEAIKSEFERTGNFDFASFLLFAKKQFQKSTAETRNRTFLYITNDSNPVGADAKLKFRALNEATNFPALKIQFELIVMSANFNWDDFYEEMYKAMDTTLVKERCEDDDGVLDKILPIVEPMLHHRSVRFFPVINNQKLFMKVYIDSFFNSRKIVFNKLLTRDRHAEVKRVNSNRGIETEKIVVVAKDVEIKLKSEEVEMLRSSSYPVGYALLGVLKEPMTRPEMIIKKHDLMMENPKETCNHFNIFWKYCVEKKRLLLCSFRARKNSSPNFCELTPKVYSNKRAFLIKYLYFEEDIVVNPEIPCEEEKQEDVKEPDEAQLDTVRKLVTALKFPYEPNAFVDVQGARQEAYVKAQALEQPLETVDDVLENKEKIDKILDDLGLVQKRSVPVKEEKCGQAPRQKKPRGGGGRGRVKKEV